MLNIVGFFTYLVLSVVESMAVLILGLIMYRLPVWEYKMKLLGIAVLLSVSSYLFRLVWEIPVFDLPVEMIMIILFYRYGLQIRLFYSALILSASLNVYFALQVTILYSFIYIGSMDYGIVLQSIGAQTQLVQISSTVGAYLIAGFLKLFNNGFSFILSPPHDFSIKVNYREGTDRALFAVVIVSLIISSSTLFVMFNYQLYLLMPSCCAIFGLSYYLSYKKEKEPPMQTQQLKKDKK